MAAYFGDGQLASTDLAAGIVRISSERSGAGDKLIWQKYLETVVKTRGLGKIFIVHAATCCNQTTPTTHMIHILRHTTPWARILPEIYKEFLEAVKSRILK